MNTTTADKFQIQYQREDGSWQKTSLVFKSLAAAEKRLAEIKARNSDRTRRIVIFGTEEEA